MYRNLGKKEFKKTIKHHKKYFSLVVFPLTSVVFVYSIINALNGTLTFEGVKFAKTSFTSILDYLFSNGSPNVMVAILILSIPVHVFAYVILIFSDYLVNYGKFYKNFFLLTPLRKIGNSFLSLNNSLFETVLSQQLAKDDLDELKENFNSNYFRIFLESIKRKYF